MNPASRLHAVILLTVEFGKSSARPLSASEWTRLSSWLKDHQLDPSMLVEGDPGVVLRGFSDRTIPLERIEGLLARGFALGLALEKWQRTGLWIIAQPESEYPERLRHRLRHIAPPVLFGCGNKEILDRGGLGIVGSRQSDPDDIAFAEQLGGMAAEEGLTVVSGAARGVDESSMLGSLRREGTSLGVVAHSLLCLTTTAKYRKHLVSGALALVSPFNPEAGFNAGNAMSRNKCIYCLSDWVTVVNSSPNKGGTWNGAVENLRAGWVPLLVRRNSSKSSGNSALSHKGAGLLTGLEKVRSLKNPAVHRDSDSPTIV